MRLRRLSVVPVVLGFAACTTTEQQGTLAELAEVPADVDEVYLEDSLERAAESYRRYLEETPQSARTPEAMRRLADLQIEQAYGVIGSGEIVEMASPDTSTSRTASGWAWSTERAPRSPSRCSSSSR